ncbi:MAG: hypothetical protein ACPG4T_22215 [Nannocystaceae bacterium]
MRRQTWTAPLVWLAVVTVAGAMSLLGARPAAACGNAVLSQEDRVLRVKKAETLLATGHYRKAARLVRSLFTFLRLPPQEKFRPLFFPAQRVLALAVVRSGGSVDYHGAHSHEENLTWARNRLAAHHELWPNEPAITAAYAEGLATTSPNQAGALLHDLDARDVLPTAAGYATWSRLAADSGDPITYAYAQFRCRAIVKSESSICDPVTS